MRFLKKIGMMVYMILMLAAGSLVFFISLDIVPVEQCAGALNILHGSMGWQIVMWAVSAIFIITGIITPIRVARTIRSGRMIKFQNPDGEVTISISAIE
ncbi:MAG: hypothetical protein KAS86_04085, partial [Candidatus Omnitrophica bacterium]|nr:hypothetical protein [Candidatus Omnitrophota bacterium]